MDRTPAFSTAASCLDALLSQSASRMRGTTERPTSCCCGNLQCAYLQHNNAALEGLEDQLENAARIGQVGACFLGTVFDPSNETILPGPERLSASEHLVILMLAIKHQLCVLEAANCVYGPK